MSLAALACTRDLDLIQDPPRAVAATTTGPWASMIYVARTDSGLIAIDLGWAGAEELLPRLARTLGDSSAAITHVFLTHAHRDHVAAWPLVRQATFVLGAEEAPYLAGVESYSAWVPRIGDGLNGYPKPTAGELRLLPVGSDTAIALGKDTVFVYRIPGHTPGSVAYSFRGILFGGDAINWRPVSGFQGARPEFSDNLSRSRESMRDLWERLAMERARVACSAHGKCARVDSSFRSATSR